MDKFRHLALAMALILSSLGAVAAGLVPGDYVMIDGGWGTLKIKPGGQAFSIETVGANLHICNVDGPIQNGVGRPEEVLEGQGCVIRFKAQARDIEVTGEGDGCRNYCGMRAWFDGKYRLPPVACTSKALRKRRDDFLTDYRAKRYEPAYSKVQSLYSECKEYYNRVEIDALRNDVALAQLRVGRPADCLETLKETVGWDSPNQKALEEESGLPPSDFDMVLPAAKATWTNRRLCEKALARKP